MNVLFETKRVLARKLEPEDAARLFENHAEEKVKKWFPNESYADISEAEDAIRFFSDCVEKDRLPFVLAIQLKETGELIGDTGVSEIEGQPDAVEIGYQICDKYSGKGLATEVLNAMTAFSFARFTATVSYGRVVHGNAASTRVLEKAGYVFVNEEFGAEDDPYGNGMLVYKREARSPGKPEAIRSDK
jgi:ribosomal-protein-alanine N-acetyltransferase